jgi:protein-disulfide isomerase
VRRLALGLLLTTLALTTLALSTVSCGAELPVVLRDEVARAPRGTVTVVFFTDFQCPFCRRTHEKLASVLAQHEGHVRVVLHHLPLRSHPDARGAARAAICVEQLTDPNARTAEDYASALFASADLSDASCEQIATAHGVDRERFRQCVADAATDARIERDIDLFESVDGDGVPLLYVGRTRLDGEPSRGALESAIDSALAREK